MTDPVLPPGMSPTGASHPSTVAQPDCIPSRYPPPARNAKQATGAAKLRDSTAPLAGCQRHSWCRSMSTQ